MNGYFMAMKSDGTPTPLGKVTEINTITELPTPQLYLLSQKIINEDRGAFFGNAYDLSYTDVYEFSLTKKNKKAWAKILNMPKFALTEWIFPRKKKRGTKRRIRKVERQGLEGETNEYK